MPNKQQRERNANNYRDLIGKLPSGRNCSNCAKPLNYNEGHFVPPSFGESGFWICSKVAA